MNDPNQPYPNEGREEEPTAAEDGTSSTQITINLNTDMTAAQRFPAWILLCVSSIVCVIALQSRRGFFDVDDAGEAWILSVGSISFLLSLAAIVMYLCFRTVFVSNIPEAVMVRERDCVCVWLGLYFMLQLRYCAAVHNHEMHSLTHSPAHLLSLLSSSSSSGWIIDCILGGGITHHYESEQ